MNKLPLRSLGDSQIRHTPRVPRIDTSVVFQSQAASGYRDKSGFA
jgi:hypothetical protein